MRAIESIRGENRSMRPGLGALVGVSVAFVLLGWLWRPALTPQDAVSLSPRENVALAIADAIAEDGSLGISVPELEVWPSDLRPGLVPRDAAALDATVVAQDSLGLFALLALARLVGPWGIFLINPVFVGVCGAALAISAYRATSSRASVVVTSLLVAASGSLYSASVAYASGDVVSAALLACGLAIQITRHSGIGFGYLTGLLIALAVSVRYANLLIAFAIWLSALLGQDSRVRFFASSITGGAPIGLLLLYGHYRMYGDPFTTGYALRRDLLEFVGIGERHWLDASQAIAQLSTHARSIGLLIFFGFVVVGLRVFAHRSVRSRALPEGVLAVGTILMMVSAASLVLYGDHAFAWNSSFLRYVLPCLVVMTPTAAVGIQKFRRLGNRPLALLCLIIVIAGAPQVFGPGGMSDFAAENDRASELVSAASRYGGVSTMFYTRSLDKYLWPEHSVLIAPHLAHLDTALIRGSASRGSAHPYALIPPPAEAADHIVAALSREKSVYLASDLTWPDSFYMLDLCHQLLLRDVVMVRVWEGRRTPDGLSYSLWLLSYGGDSGSRSVVDAGQARSCSPM